MFKCTTTPPIKVHAMPKGAHVSNGCHDRCMILMLFVESYYAMIAAAPLLLSSARPNIHTTAYTLGCANASASTLYETRKRDFSLCTQNGKFAMTQLDTVPEHVM